MTPLQLILDALAFAAEKHRDQRRKDPEASPYVNHPIALARILAHEGNVDEAAVLAAALLHDTVEDTETTIEELKQRFGPRVASMVAEVTDDKALPPPVRKRLQVEHAGQLSHGARLVKLADKIANLRDLGKSPPPSWTLERRQQYFDWAREVVDQLRGTNAPLEKAFEKAYAAKPKTPRASGKMPAKPAGGIKRKAGTRAKTRARNSP